MKYILCLAMLLLCLRAGFAQEFSFSLVFQDAAGNRDSLVLGYDWSATGQIDPSFGEENIVDQALNPEFDVRVSNLLYASSLPEAPFQTKKQILMNSCGQEYQELPILMIDIRCNHWPVTASWDASLFSDSCLAFSDFASFPFHQGWDAFCLGHFWTSLWIGGQISFDKCCDSGCPQDELVSYINNQGDTIMVYWLGLDDQNLVSGGVTGSSDLPGLSLRQSEQQLVLDPLPAGIELVSLSLFDLSGRKVARSRLPNLNISHLIPGLYLCRLALSDGSLMAIKFLKY